ncbi:MAG: response regulator [Ignavibacteriaceae bacterium]|nr:response regulator [Ignavibacteriaceae bacterium]
MNSNLQSKTILIVDDAPENIAILGELLSEYQLKVATSGEKALEIINSGSGKIDLILLDIIMPGIDGLEVARRLKSDSATASIPVIFVTAKSDAGSFIKGFELGAEDYITKPFEAEVIKALVNKILK